MFNDLDGCNAVIFSFFFGKKVVVRCSLPNIHTRVCYVGIDKEQFIEELNVNKTLGATHVVFDLLIYFDV